VSSDKSITITERASCPFCDLLASERLQDAYERVLSRGHTVSVIFDRSPVTRLHCLVIPTSHIDRWDRARSLGVFTEMTMRISDVQRALRERDRTIVGFNVGWNDGHAAGQTVDHLHIHVIPRRENDVLDPRGGVRCARCDSEQTEMRTVISGATSWRNVESVHVA
jgi:ATP adenylyltransferase